MSNMSKRKKEGTSWHELPREEIKKYVGQMDQIAGIITSILQDGKSFPSRSAYIYNGSGLEFSVYLDRCMDISHARYKGIPLGWRSTPGDVAPFYYEAEGIRWLRSYFGGLLTTCGVTNVGPPCERSELTGEGLHGRISNTPAEDISIEKRWEGNKYLLQIKGKMRQTALFAENIVVEREITTYLGAPCFKIIDTVINEGFRKTPFMMLYHCNIGWPVVCEGAKVCIPVKRTIPRDEIAKQGKDAWYEITQPVENYQERVYFHDVKAHKNGEVVIGIYHEKPKLEEKFYGIYIKYKKSQLPKLVQWKMLGTGEYVIGLEPCNAGVLGRDETERKGELDYLKPGEVRTHELEIGIIDAKKKEIFKDF